jgi:hypothetical protein
MKRFVGSKNFFLLLGLVIAILSFLPAGGKEQQLVLVTGKVCDARSVNPLHGVEVRWKDVRTRSDDTGHYEIKVPIGVRELSFSVPERVSVRKLLLVRRLDQPVVLDVLLPASPTEVRKVLALNRGSRLTPDGKDLESDVAADSTISLADEYGNHDQLLTLRTEGARVHSPVWWNTSAFLFAKEAVLHRKSDQEFMGVFEYETSSGKLRQLASQAGIHFVDRSPRRDSIVTASQHDLYVIDYSSSGLGSPRRIYGLGPNHGFILSVAWGYDDRLYFTVDESISIDAQHSLTKSRIASIKPDGTDLKPDWAAASQYSYRYPVRGASGEILFSRFTLDGREQTVWKKNTDDGHTSKILDAALRAVRADSTSKRLYYIYKQGLHLKDLKSGSDLLIVNSVEEAAYLAH